MRNLRRSVRLIVLVLSSVSLGATDYGGYRPHYQGFAFNTVGGRGPDGGATSVTCAVNSVSNANTGGAVGGAGNPDFRGTLSFCLGLNKHRFILLETSGTFSIPGDIVVTNPYFTLAGQTAPNPGILFRDGAIYFNAAHGVIQHVVAARGKVGCYSTCGSSSLVLGVPPNGVAAHDLVVDHVTAVWGTSTVMYSVQQAKTLLVVDTLVGEGISNPNVLSQFATPTFLTYSSNAEETTLARNAFVNTGNRNPWLSPAGRITHYNNLAYNPACITPCDINTGGVYGFGQIIGLDANYVAGTLDLVSTDNAFIRGPNTADAPPRWKIGLGSDQVPSTIYFARESLQGAINADQWAPSEVMFCASGCGSGHGGNVANIGNTKALAPPAWVTTFNLAVLTNTGVNVRDFVLANVGARPLNRDPISAHMVQDVQNGTGATHGGFNFTDPSQAGGYPSGAGWSAGQEVTRSLTGQIPTNPFAAGTCGSTVTAVPRTRLECWLENDPTYGAQRLEVTQGLPSSAPAPPGTLVLLSTGR